MKKQQAHMPLRPPALPCQTSHVTNLPDDADRRRVRPSDGGAVEHLEVAGERSEEPSVLRTWIPASHAPPRQSCAVLALARTLFPGFVDPWADLVLFLWPNSSRALGRSAAWAPRKDAARARTMAALRNMVGAWSLFWCWLVCLCWSVWVCVAEDCVRV